VNALRGCSWIGQLSLEDRRPPFAVASLAQSEIHTFLMLSISRWVVCCLLAEFVSAMSMTLSSNHDLRCTRQLPEKLLVSYTTTCSTKVSQAVRHGVNVVIWAFCEMVIDSSTNKAKCISRFDRQCAKEMIAQLDAEGYDDTIHLVSFGGWNGRHLPDELTAEDMYAAWKEHCGDIFHGVDWDLEGHDQLDSPTNVFSVQCLENMGRFSELAKEDGYIIGMAPPQSYLDHSTSSFSRKVNLTDESREWHKGFHYFGANVYAYVLAKYGDYIDFVSIQFYESYSRAGLNILHYKMPQDEYLYSYVRDLVNDEKESFFVDFEQDPELKYSSKNVQFPRSKLVFGFANGWGADDGEKVCYFEPDMIAKAYQKLESKHMAPKGMMYWVM
jgi:beta-glucosidase